MARLVVEDDDTLTLNGTHGDCLVRLATVAVQHDNNDDDRRRRQQQQQQQQQQIPDLLIVGTAPAAAAVGPNDGISPSTATSTSTTTTTTTTAFLRNQGISIDAIAQDKKEDLRDTVHCWISKSLYHKDETDDKYVAYKRVLVWEPPAPPSSEEEDKATRRGGSTRSIVQDKNDDDDDDEAAIYAVEAIFCGMIAMAKDECQTVELHLCSSFGSFYKETSLLKAVIKATEKWIQRGLDIYQLTIVLSRRPERKNWSHAFRPPSTTTVHPTTANTETTTTTMMMMTPNSGGGPVEAIVAAHCVDEPIEAAMIPIYDEAMESSSSFRGRKRMCCIICILLIVVVAIVLILVLTISADGNSIDQNPSGGTQSLEPTSSPVFQNQGPTSPPSRVTAPTFSTPSPSITPFPTPSNRPTRSPTRAPTKIPTGAPNLLPPVSLPSPFPTPTITLGPVDTEGPAETPSQPSSPSRAPVIGTPWPTGTPVEVPPSAVVATPFPTTVLPPSDSPRSTILEQGIRLTLQGINGIRETDYQTFEDVTADFTMAFFSGDHLLALTGLYATNVTITSVTAINGQQEGVRGRRELQERSSTTTVVYSQEFSFFSDFSSAAGNQATLFDAEYLATAPFTFEQARTIYVNQLVESGARSFTTLERTSPVTLTEGATSLPTRQPVAAPSPFPTVTKLDDGLSAGQIVGIVIGCLVVVLGLLYLLLIFQRRKEKDEPVLKPPNHKQPEYTNTVPSSVPKLPDKSPSVDPPNRIRIVLAYSELDSAVAESAKQVLALIDKYCDVVAKAATIYTSAELSDSWKVDKSNKNVRVIALLTPNFIKNLACLDQLNECLLSSKRNILLPILIEETDLPKYLQLVQYHDARPGGIDKLMTILSSIMNSINHEISDQPAAVERSPSVSFKDPRFDVFVSYSSKLRAQANAAVEILRHLRPDIKCFIDHNELRAGARWQQTLYNALDSSQVTMIILTPGFLQSSFCREETAIAALRAAEGSGQIVTLETVPVPAAAKTDLPEEIVESLVEEETLFEACERALKLLDAPRRQSVEQATTRQTTTIPRMRDTRSLLHGIKMKSLLQAHQAWTSGGGTVGRSSSFRQPGVPKVCIAGHSRDMKELLRIQAKVLSGFLNRRGVVKTVTQKENDVDSIDSATILICVLSTEFLKSSFCMNALNIGIFRNRSEGGYLIPIVVEALDPYEAPSFVRLLPSLDATSWTEEDETHVLQDVICAAANLARANRWKDRATLVGSCGSFTAWIEDHATN